MKEGFEAFKDHVDLTAYAVSGIRGLLIYVTVGIVATVIMQSSHATLVLTIAALASGQVGYENALALAIGSNIGTTITAVLGSIGANIDGKRLAAAHMLFNLVTGFIAIAFLGVLVQAVSWISAVLGIAAQDYTLQLAVFHSLFNLIGVALFLPLTQPLASLLARAIRSATVSEAQPLYLNEAARGIPDVSVEAVRRETLHLLSNAFEVLAHGLGLHRRELRSDVPLPDLVARRSRPPVIDIDERYERSIKPLAGAIMSYISRGQTGLDAGAAEDLFALRTSTRQIVEAVKGIKHLNKNLSRNMNSTNADIRAQYDLIRIRLGEVLRRVASLELPDTDTVTTLSFDDAKLNLLQLDDEMTTTVATLIREERIPVSAVTSLLNDAHYATEVGMNLLSVLQVLTSVGDRGARTALSGVTLDASELRGLEVSAQPEERA